MNASASEVCELNCSLEQTCALSARTLEKRVNAIFYDELSKNVDWQVIWYYAREGSTKTSLVC